PDTGDGPLATWTARPDAVSLPVQGAYARFSTLGYDYGPNFQGLRTAWEDETGVGGEAELDTLPDDATGMAGPHPASADAGLHAWLSNHHVGSGERRGTTPA